MKSFNLIYFLFSFFIAGLIWSIVSFFLPKVPVIYIPNVNDTSFFRIDLRDIFTSNQHIKQIKKPTYSIKGLKLKAIYNNGNKGFIIVEDSKSHFIDYGKYYKGYKLTKITKDYVEFTKNNKIYKLTFGKIKAPKIDIRENVIPKKTLIEYKNNLAKVWSNISIVNDKRGYKITYIKPKSIFDKIGLKRGDIIVSVNGKKLLNDADAWSIYKNAQNYDNFEIEIIRNNQIKVINYEID